MRGDVLPTSVHVEADLLDQELRKLSLLGFRPLAREEAVVGVVLAFCDLANKVDQGRLEGFEQPGRVRRFRPFLVLIE
ncbi:MAG: hypothetical protein CNCCGFBP_00423 [Fimbriimonadaceae bacterium]|nr:hypothetical protein [Fimbriimonadaceae bacterium]